MACAAAGASVRAQALDPSIAPAQLRGAGGVDLPGLPAAAGGAAATAAGDRLPADAGADLDWRLIATQQALQLEALIAWTQAQAAAGEEPAPGR